MTFLSPNKVAESAKNFVKYQIEKEVSEKQQVIAESSVAKAAFNIAGKLGFEKKQIQASLDNDLPEKIASIVAATCGYDCETKKIWRSL